jgi:hypothetical protein
MDTQSGFRVYPAELIASLKPRWGGGVFETEILMMRRPMGGHLEVPAHIHALQGGPAGSAGVTVSRATYIVCQARGAGENAEDSLKVAPPSPAASLAALEVGRYYLPYRHNLAA